MEVQSFYSSHGLAISLFGILTVIIHKIAKKKGFYSVDPSLPFKDLRLSFLSVLSFFTIYVLCFLLLPVKCLLYLHKLFPTFSSMTLFGLAELLSVFFLFSSFYLLSKCMNKPSVAALWKTPASWKKTTLLQDSLLGITTWLLAFPFVTFLNQCSDLLLYVFWNVQGYEQSAVSHFKATAHSPFAYTITFLLVVLVCPFIEEILFRGLLQSWLKKRCGIFVAILLSSLIFALFHMDKSQGLGNISLFLSLATLGGFLGFLYEKQQSLFSSLSLHITFNCISAFRLIFFSDS